MNEGSEKSDFPLVSIALCVYNGEKFLREQLDSLVSQTYPTLEIIVVDDCSKDGSVEILEKYTSEYPFIKIFQNDQNLGYVKNFEKALTLCTGEFIALCDQDDAWHPDKIRLQKEAIQNNTLIYHDSAFVDEKGNPVNRKMSDIIRLYRGAEPEVFLLYNCVSGHSCFFRRDLLKEILPFHPDHFHDHWIAWVATNLGTIDFIPECLVNYRQHTESSTDILNKRKKLDKSYHENRDVKKLTRELKWLKHCASFAKNKNPLFLENFIRLFETRLDTFFSVTYAGFICDHFELLFYIQKLRKSSRSGYIYRQIWGLKAKIFWANLFGK